MVPFIGNGSITALSNRHWYPPGLACMPPPPPRPPSPPPCSSALPLLQLGTSPSC
jgi:hypothetical protein